LGVLVLLVVVLLLFLLLLFLLLLLPAGFLGLPSPGVLHRRRVPLRIYFEDFLSRG